MNKEIKIKSLLFGLSLLIVGYANAQTTTETQTPATSQSQATNPQIEVLKQKIAANPQDTQSLVTLATAYQDAQDYTSLYICNCNLESGYNPNSRLGASLL